MSARPVRPARRVDPGVLTIASVIPLLLALLATCVAERPLVERFERDDWRPVPFRLESLGGQRAGASVVFVLRLAGPSDRRLIVEGTVEIDPQAKLQHGRWEEDGTGASSGAVSSAALDFFGGQGDRPSLGGQLTLSAGGAPVYRINLPATTLSAAR